MKELMDRQPGRPDKDKKKDSHRQSKQHLDNVTEAVVKATHQSRKWAACDSRWACQLRRNEPQGS
jgi:hypothetical protein